MGPRLRGDDAAVWVSPPSPHSRVVLRDALSDSMTRAARRRVLGA